MPEQSPQTVRVLSEDSGRRLDQFLAAWLESVSSARVQEMIAEGRVLVNDGLAKPSLKLRGGSGSACWARVARFFLEYLRDDPGRGSVFGGAMTGTQLIAIGLVVAGGLIWWLRPGAKPVPAQTVGATR